MDYFNQHQHINNLNIHFDDDKDRIYSYFKGYKFALDHKKKSKAFDPEMKKWVGSFLLSCLVSQGDLFRLNSVLLLEGNMHYLGITTNSKIYNAIVTLSKEDTNWETRAASYRLLTTYYLDLILLQERKQDKNKYLKQANLVLLDGLNDDDPRVIIDVIDHLASLSHNLDALPSIYNLANHTSPEVRFSANEWVQNCLEFNTINYIKPKSK